MDKLKFLREQLLQHTRNLNRLQEQLAIYGAGEQPLRLLNQIEAEREKIEAIEAQLDLLSKDNLKST